ncbi:relaxase/mobilization nuclease-like protein [Herbinix hemicellulosilytica]|uniref:MobA/VirD2-like nuclease domain-containing protein n=1 Tax=Herbinix hemicellulosilytica TaxID=1564487 RepID=A0A0H5SHX3_HERHM|nr:relaxase/mobilization nuclease domain-containing protein [Herbinix hemicellulosilytica]RBP57083.1 relaxase/mobilization nuclease-like protein [Herbinix hemicellulosilytica]CRZ35092.1 hypothetical protein HHT355_1893 [Herbinix hemicellulosilytica]
MAATRIIPMHHNKGKTVAQCLKDRIDYAENGEKTENGEFINSYACDPETAEEEFMLSKREYFELTGRTPKGDVIAYQVRQSFKPGEITPEEANQIGYELAMKLTKGNHAFIVATHTDRAHIHNHIIWNSTDLNCTRKFRNIIGSFLVVQHISDQLCLEHGLSVIKPRPRKEREKFPGHAKRKTLRSDVCEAIDIAITKNPRSFDELLLLLEEAGYEIKRGKHISLKGENQKRFVRMDTLGTGYSESELRSIFEEVQNEKQRPKPKKEFDLLINIQEKLAQGKGRGYENWAKVFNVKQIAQTLLFLEQNGIRDYSVLEEKAKSSSARFEELSATIKSAEKRLAEIAVLKTHIINYSKTRDVYVAYRKSGYSKKFFEAHREEITLHKAAKEAFSALPESQKKDGRIPTVKQLNEEYARVLDKKKKAYSEYREAREEMKKYTMAKHNIDEFMRKSEQEERNQKKRKELSR